MSADIQTIVIGAGAVGLATARALACAGHEVLIVEAEYLFGSQTSARNSEVIHAGIYYKKDSLKAQLCVAGKAMLYDYCDTRSVEHKACGKLIVACNAEQNKALLNIQQRALNNGVNDLQLLDSGAVAEIEPQLNTTSALLSPSTGIIDSHGYMLSLLGEAEQHGAMIAYNTQVNNVQAHESGTGYKLTLHDTQDNSQTTLHCINLVNSAGHGAPALAAPWVNTSVKAGFSKGNYFKLDAASPVERLIYPIPEPGGLGVHITLDLSGQVRFGPDVEAIDELHYVVDPSRATKFYAAVRQYWPGLKDHALIPDYAGIRPKVYMNKQLADDFIILDGAKVGKPGLVNLLGIESPGLTASLAIAAQVKQLLR